MREGRPRENGDGLLAGIQDRAGRAPMWPIAWVARRQPAARASAGGLPSSQAGRKPAAKASPPPVPSTTLSMGSALTVIGSALPLVYQRAPSAPSLITTWGYQAVSTLAAA